MLLKKSDCRHCHHLAKKNQLKTSLFLPKKPSQRCQHDLTVRKHYEKSPYYTKKAIPANNIRTSNNKIISTQFHIILGASIFHTELETRNTLLAWHLMSWLSIHVSFNSVVGSTFFYHSKSFCLVFLSSFFILLTFNIFLFQNIKISQQRTYQEDTPVDLCYMT